MKQKTINRNSSGRGLSGVKIFVNDRYARTTSKSGLFWFLMPVPKKGRQYTVHFEKPGLNHRCYVTNGLELKGYRL